MDTYSVQVHQRSLGIGFISTCDTYSSGNTEQVVISEVNPNSKGYELGLNIGDTLIAINDKLIKSIDEYYDNNRTLPFNLTFRKSNILQSMSDPLSPETIATSNPLASFMMANLPKNQNKQRNSNKISNKLSRNIKKKISKKIKIVSKQSPLQPQFVNNSESNIRDKSNDFETPKWSTSASVPIANFKKKDNKPNFNRAKSKAQGTGTPKSKRAHIPSNSNMINNRFSRNYNRNSLEISDFVQSLRKRGFNTKSKDGIVNFDKYKVYNNNTSICLLSSGCLSKGYYQWSLKIIKCSIYRQEIGVISNEYNLKSLGTGNSIYADSLSSAKELGARAIYCNEIATNSIYYASYNSNGTQRCHKELKSNNNENKWKEGDVIKIYLDLDRWNIKFYLNDKKVRKAISVEPYKKYYPVISFIGDCKYQLL